MKISTKGEYGIRALMELTVRHGQGYVQSTDIAAARNIPANYLYQLLITLRKAGIIRSRRGPQGGHMLARPPVDINLADAVVALEGPLAPGESCAFDAANHERVDPKLVATIAGSVPAPKSSITRAPFMALPVVLAQARAL